MSLWKFIFFEFSFKKKLCWRVFAQNWAGVFRAVHGFSETTQKGAWYNLFDSPS